MGCHLLDPEQDHANRVAGTVDTSGLSGTLSSHEMQQNPFRTGHSVHMYLEIHTDTYSVQHTYTDVTFGQSLNHTIRIYIQFTNTETSNMSFQNSLRHEV